MLVRSYLPGIICLGQLFTLSEGAYVLALRKGRKSWFSISNVYSRFKSLEPIIPDECYTIGQRGLDEGVEAIAIYNKPGEPMIADIGFYYNKYCGEYANTVASPTFIVSLDPGPSGNKLAGLWIVDLYRVELSLPAGSFRTIDIDAERNKEDTVLPDTENDPKNVVYYWENNFQDPEQPPELMRLEGLVKNLRDPGDVLNGLEGTDLAVSIRNRAERALAKLAVDLPVPVEEIPDEIEAYARAVLDDVRPPKAPSGGLPEAPAKKRTGKATTPSKLGEPGWVIDLGEAGQFLERVTRLHGTPKLRVDRLPTTGNRGPGSPEIVGGEPGSYIPESGVSDEEKHLFDEINIMNDINVPPSGVQESANDMLSKQLEDEFDIDYEMLNAGKKFKPNRKLRIAEDEV